MVGNGFKQKYNQEATGIARHLFDFSSTTTSAAIITTTTVTLSPPTPTPAPVPVANIASLLSYNATRLNNTPKDSNRTLGGPSASLLRSGLW